jgi:hypothetical protein
MPRYLLHAGFLLVLFYYTEDDGDIFIRNIGWLLAAYLAL